MLTASGPEALTSKLSEEIAHGRMAMMPIINKAMYGTRDAAQNWEYE